MPPEVEIILLVNIFSEEEIGRSIPKLELPPEVVILLPTMKLTFVFAEIPKLLLPLPLVEILLFVMMFPTE